MFAYLEVHRTNLSWKKVAVHCLGFVVGSLLTFLVVLTGVSLAADVQAE